MEYRRNFVPGGTYFFTLVTFDRRPILADDWAVRLLGESMRETQSRRPFTCDAVVVLPDHLHAVWTLPPADADYPVRWSAIKAAFTRRFLASGGTESPLTAAMHAEGRRGVLQPRYYEHTIKDEDDYAAHLDYCHYNPVKHGCVRCPKEWPHSSFHRHVALGRYEADWACGDRPLPATLGRIDANLAEGVGM